jgi:hypothetical protein
MQLLLAVRVARMALFRGTANRSSADLAPYVEHRSLTVKHMGPRSRWVYGNTAADELGIPNSLCTTVF